MEHSTGTFRGFGGVELFCQRWRPEGAVSATLVLAHGYQDHSDRLLPLAQHLVPRGYAVYSFDLRGHGRSPGQRGHIDSWADYREDLRAFLAYAEAQQPGRPLFLGGHSLGGLIALEYALRQPEGLRGVIALAPALAAEGSALQIAIARAASRLFPRLSQPLKLEMAAIARDPAIVRAHERDPLRHGRATARWGTEFFATIDWCQAHAPSLRLPLLLLYGDADRIVLPEGSRRFFAAVTFPDKERHEYAGAYHLIFDDTNRQEVLGDLTGWLERHR